MRRRLGEFAFEPRIRNVSDPDTVKKVFKMPSYFAPKYVLHKEHQMVPPSFTNNVLKLRVREYPFMNLLKHIYPTLSDDCYWCPSHPENLSHILFHCPQYEDIRRALSLPDPIRSTDVEILKQTSLVKFHPNRLNVITLNRFLTRRWALLGPILQTLREESVDNL